MRRSVLTGLFTCAVLAAVSNSTVSAEAQNTSIASQLQGSVSSAEALTPINLVTEEEAVEAPVEAPVEPKVHTVAENENLSTIAEQYETTWVRIFNKNTQISHPDNIVVGDAITIPEPDETLAERPLPEPPVAVAQARPAARQASRMSLSTRYARGSSAGNTYTAGYCTWYAKDRRPDLPNNLGNANTWVSRAAAQGIPTGSEPRAGAIGQQGNHVVYVESVNGDGTVNVSEMNYRGLYVVSRRTVPASYFRYIY